MIHVFKESWPFLFLSSQRKFLFLRAGLQGKESPRHFIKLLILLCYSVSLRRLWIERWRRKFMERNIRLLTLTCIRQILKSSPPKVSLVKNHLPSASLFEFYFFNFKRQFLDLLLTHSNIYFSAHVFLWGGKYLGKRNTKTTCLWIFQDIVLAGRWKLEDWLSEWLIIGSMLQVFQSRKHLIVGAAKNLSQDVHFKE